MNSRVAGRVIASIAVEVVEHALGSSAAKTLAERDRLVIPSLLARSGAALNWYQEWLEHARGVLRPGGFDGQRLLRAWEETQSASRFFKAPVKQAAMLAAVGRLAAALRLD
jgi:glutamate dehydrogenase/leucine dehydrogenase